MNASNDNAGTQERRTLWIVLLLNAAIAAGFFVSGAFADSSAVSYTHLTLPTKA